MPYFKLVFLSSAELHALVVGKLDDAIHRMNHYPVDSVVCFVSTYPLDSVIQPSNNRCKVFVLEMLSAR